MPASNAAAYTLVLQSHVDQQQTATPAQLEGLYRRVSWRVLPLLCTCIMLNYLDRTSLAFASLQMTEQLHFSPEVLGLGGGLFFLSYCLMQVRQCMLRAQSYTCAWQCIDCSRLIKSCAQKESESVRSFSRHRRNMC